MKFDETLNFFIYLFIFLKNNYCPSHLQMYNKIVCLEEIDAYYKYM